MVSMKGHFCDFPVFDKLNVRTSLALDFPTKAKQQPNNVFSRNRHVLKIQHISCCVKSQQAQARNSPNQAAEIQALAKQDLAFLGFQVAQNKA